MAKNGNGEGSIYPHRKSGKKIGYRGSYWVHTAEGPKRRYVSGKTRDEVHDKLGSGSQSNDLGIVTMHEELQTYLVHLIGLGERKCLPDEACQALAQGVVPSLHVRQLSALLAHRLVALLGDYRPVCLPQIAIATPPSVVFGDPLP